MAELTLSAGAAPAPALESPFDEAALRERVEGDTELLREIVELFLEDSPRLMEEVRTAVAAGDALSLKRSAHTLKGAASNFGAAAVVATALELEMMGHGGDLAQAAPACDRLAAALSALDAALGRLASVEPHTVKRWALPPPLEPGPIGALVETDGQDWFILRSRQPLPYR